MIYYSLALIKKIIDNLTKSGVLLPLWDPQGGVTNSLRTSCNSVNKGKIYLEATKIKINGFAPRSGENSLGLPGSGSRDPWASGRVRAPGPGKSKKKLQPVLFLTFR
jgi:hypothetical protein